LPEVDTPHLIEGVLAVALSAGLGAIVFSGLVPYAFLCLVPIVWTAVRLGRRATATSTLLVSLVGIGETVRGHGPFVAQPIEEPLLPLMVFLVVSSVGALAVAALILERRRGEQVLREFAQIVASSEDAIVGTSRDGTVTSWNAAAERLYGYEAREALGRTIRLGHGTEDTLSILGRVAVGEKVESFDTVQRRKDGSSAQISLAVSPVKDAAGRVVGISSIARDVSDRLRFFDLRQHAATLAEENRKIQESSEQKSRFVSHVSHELRTPLTAIIGFSDMLREERLGPLTPVQTRCLQDIELSCQHLLRLVEEVLELAKLDANKIELRLETVDIGQVVAEVTDMLTPLSAAKQLQMSARVDETLNAEQADKGRLRQVLFNYLSNALKFAPAGGSIEVRAEPESVNWWRLEVQDNGRGVPVGQEKNLFQEFERLGVGASSTEGIGLGLAIAKRIVEAQGGSVGYRPAPGGGSIFSARMPRAL
jgi:PAS domain S-box-containing protein